jgi:hypothetical protein
MRWFRRANLTEIWDASIEAPLGDIEAAKRIREICRSAADSAEKVGKVADRIPRRIEGEVERYERAARVAMEIAMKMSDEWLRDVAVSQIVELCVKANSLTTAQTLLRAIQSKSIRDDVLREFPLLS